MSLTALVGSLLVAVVSDAVPRRRHPRTSPPTNRSRRSRPRRREPLRLALWCERRGLEAERVKHLALAVLIDPDHAAARGLLGLVAYRGGWHSPEAVAERDRSDGALAATRAAYRARRARRPAPPTATGSWRMWCGENGLEEEATAHLTAVTRLDPSREAAWKRLDYQRYEGRWMTADQAAALKADREAQAAADRVWTPRLLAWRAAIGRPGDRSEAEARLAAVSDPPPCRRSGGCSPRAARPTR